MNLLVFKLAATPTLILVATLASRRFGQATGGWIVGLPLTSGPIAVFLALEHGAAFAQAAAAGSPEGTVGQAFFASTYARLAARRHWSICLAGASAAFVVSSVAVAALGLPMPMLAAVAAVSLALGLRLIARPAATTAAARAEEAPDHCCSSISPGRHVFANHGSSGP